MKKNKHFFIVKYNPVDDKAYVEVVKGRMSDDEVYGFHYIKEPKLSRWVCTDIKSGLRVTEQRTIEECENYLFLNHDKIEATKQKHLYQFYVDKFNACVKEYLMQQEAEKNAGW